MAATVETDVAIIGAGPVGLFAVFECGMLRMRCAVIDALDAIGLALVPGAGEEERVATLSGPPERLRGLAA